MSGTPRKSTAPVEKPPGTSSRKRQRTSRKRQRTSRKRQRTSRKRQRTSLPWAKLLESKIDDGDLPVVVRCLGGIGVDSCKTMGKIPLHGSLWDALGSLEAEQRCVLIEQIEEALNEEEEPPTLGSRIEEYLLAPSRVKETEVVDVACYLFGEDFASPSEVKRAVQQHVLPAAVDSQQAAAEDHAYHLVLSDTFAWTHNLSEEELPGYLPLGLLVVFFGKKLSTAQNTYKCHPQRSVARNDKPGQNPSTDVAIILRVKSGREKTSYISKVLYEYKPSVNHLLDLVESKHLMELFLQCYYVLKFENQSKLLGCLTDLHCWHYFGLTRNYSKLKVTFYSRLDMTLPPEQTELASHLSFLRTCLQ